MGKLGNKENDGSLIYAFIISFVAAVGGFLFGFDTGVIAGAIPFISRHFQLNAHQTGFAVSNLMIACTIGATFSGTLTDKYGRKKILILTALLFTISAILSAMPRTFTELNIARFIGGLAVGIASVLSPIYIAEISPAKIRGRLVALNQLAIVTGIFISYISNWQLVDVGANNWRWMLAVEAFPASIFFVLLFFIPESPRWLLKRGKESSAFSTLKKIGGVVHAEEEINEIKESLHKEEGRFIELLQPGLRKAFFVGILLALFAHITGIDTITYYGPIIFIKAGYQSISSALFGSVIIGIINLIFTFIGIAYVDKFGRRPLLLIGFAGMCFSMAAVGLTFKLQNIWVIIPILSYQASFALSVGVVIWVYVSEIFPTKIRGRAMAVATMVLWLSNVVIIQIFPWMIEKIDYNTFYIFAVICAAAFLFTYFMLMETKGKTLEEIEKMWGEAKHKEDSDLI